MSVLRGAARAIMKAVRVTEFGGPEVLKVEAKVPIPNPEDHQVSEEELYNKRHKYYILSTHGIDNQSISSRLAVVKRSHFIICQCKFIAHFR